MRCVISEEERGRGRGGGSGELESRGLHTLESVCVCVLTSYGTYVIVPKLCVYPPVDNNWGS